MNHKHLTVRMAWHDNKWDGCVCRDPFNNNYCTGAHSLLSGRIEKNKKVDLEVANACKKVGDCFSPSEVPPCFWSINAFSTTGFDLEHKHPFPRIEKSIPDHVNPNSVYTWPFRLSFVHNKDNKKKYGSYPPDLEKRVDNFIKGFSPKESIIFFYCNYDNPVSADEMKYLLLGCSVITEIPAIKEFDFEKEELKIIRNRDQSMKNFPTINWAIQVTHDPNKLVLLPYNEYLKYVEENPEDEEKLHDIKVVIDEDSLVRSFKYVAMDIDDDKCLYLLYKLRKAILKIQEHDQLVIKSDLEKEKSRIEELIRNVWEKRGIYPSLNKIINHFLENEILSANISEALKKIADKKNDMLKIFGEIIKGEVPDELSEQEEELLDLTEKRLFRNNYKALLKLSLFNLAQNQIDRIIKTKKLLGEIEENPYALYEEYEPKEDELDKPEIQDELIDVYKIDVGMIPDTNYVDRHRKIQNLIEDSPERIRSVIINYLWSIGQQGHCYDNTQNILKEIWENPLIYKNDIKIDEDEIRNLSGDYRSHFIEKLDIETTEEDRYYYLKKIRAAEKRVKEIIQKLITRPDIKSKKFDLEKHLKESLQELKEVITDEKEKQTFREERIKLYKNIFSKALYLLTGKPGSGKTREIINVVQHLTKQGENVVLLAPTGKAALRLTENIKKHTNLDLKAKTIDNYLFEKGFTWDYYDYDKLQSIKEKEKVVVDNLILDESSMIDLEKIQMLFSTIRFDDSYPKRLIMVGDENQLPPIGFGKPFHDIIQYLLKHDNQHEKHYINLQSNCRQKHYKNILKLAEAFTDKTRYYEEAFEILSSENQEDTGLEIHKWTTNEELNKKITETMNKLLKEELKEQYEELKVNDKRLNVTFGLYENGFVNKSTHDYTEFLKLEELQILTPYRTGHFGTLNVNSLIQKNYRKKNNGKQTSNFYHADKIIRLRNWYQGWDQNKKLILSNGSIGIINDHNQGKERKYYFKDAETTLSYVDDEDNFDLAYTITVHKSQGSDFENVLLIIPNKLTLLCKELLYTGLTRSKSKLILFIHEHEENLLMKAKNISHLLSRNTSIFEKPQDNKEKYFPEPGKPVKSKIEYIIYKELQKHGIQFEYEQKLELEKRHYNIHPDFTIKLKNGQTIYWEHLGMLDIRKYYKDWQQRTKDYEEHGLYDQVITTDDLEGIKQEKIDELIENIKKQNLKKTPKNRFSTHHYELY